MSKVVLARCYPPRLEKKRKKENKRKKHTLADYEFKEKRKEQEQRGFRNLVCVAKFDASYWRRVWQSDGFDVDGLESSSPERMLVFKCEKPNDCPLIVHLYIC